MINAVYHANPLIFIGAMFLKKLVSHHQAVNILLNTFEFIKAVSDTVLDMISAVYDDKLLIFIGAIFQEKLFSHRWAVNEADSCLHVRRADSKAMVQIIFWICLYLIVFFSAESLQTHFLFNLCRKDNWTML